jgi:hypothetical protein
MAKANFRRAAAVAAVLLVSGCDSTPPPPATDLLETFESAAAPATRDEVLAALPPGGLTPTPEVGEAQLQNGYLLDQYLIGGETVEVLWIHEAGEGLPTEAFRERLNPLIFRSGLLDGSGWEHFDQRAAEWGIPDRWVPSAGTQPADVRSF